MENLSTKQKLINLISALESEDCIEYFYIIIALRLHGTSACPDSHLDEIREIYDEHVKREQQREKAVIQKSDLEKDISDCIQNIMKDILAISDTKNIDVLKDIKTIIADMHKNL